MYSKPVQMCSNVFKLVQNLFKWVQTCSKFAQMSSNVFKLVQNLFKCVKCVPGCPKLVQMCLKLFKNYKPFQCMGSDMTSRAWSSFFWLSQRTFTNKALGILFDRPDWYHFIKPLAKMVCGTEPDCLLDCVLGKRSTQAK